MVEGTVLERLHTGNRIESSNLSLSASFLTKTRYFVVAQMLEYLAFSRLELACFILKFYSLAVSKKGE